jgi:hypothetical protein
MLQQRKYEERSTSLRVEPRLGTTPHFAPPTPQNAESLAAALRALMMEENLAPVFGEAFGTFPPLTLNSTPLRGQGSAL